MAIVYVDPEMASTGNGTLSSPFQSWSSVTWTAGNEYYQKAGTTFSGGIVVGASGSSGSPITIGKYGTGNDPKVTNSSGTGFQSAGRDYIVVKNFHATGCLSHGFNLRGSNCTFSDLLSTANGGSGINFALTANFSNTNYIRCVCKGNADHAIGNAGTTAGVTISNLTFTDCVGSGSTGSTKHGLYLEFQGAATGSTFSNITVSGGTYSSNTGNGINIRNTDDTYPGASLIYNTSINVSDTTCASNGVGGISILGANGGTIERNLCHSNGASGTLGGIWIGRCTSLAVQYNESRDNVSSGIDGAGIFDDQYNDGCTFTGNLIVNNVGSGGESYSGYGIAVYNAKNSVHQGNIVVGCKIGMWVSHPLATALTENIVVKNCTFVNNTAHGFWLDFDAPSDQVTLVNSIIVGSPNGIYAPATNTFLLEDYNCVSGNTTNFNSHTAGANTKTTNPELDVRHKPTRPIYFNGGSNVGGTDYYGNSFPNSPSIGAIQCVGVFPKAVYTDYVAVGDKESFIRGRGRRR